MPLNKETEPKPEWSNIADEKKKKTFYVVSVHHQTIEYWSQFLHQLQVTRGKDISYDKLKRPE